MKFEEVRDLIAGVPYTSAERGREIYEHVLTESPKKCLELGFAHGVSLCYVAAALDELGEGHIDGVDLMGVPRDPSAEQLLERCGLEKYVTLNREKSSYTWFLQKKISEKVGNPSASQDYDFCFIDGPKNWTIDGAAFFMVDMLIAENGVIVFDDYSYAYGESSGQTDGVNHRQLGEDELRIPHVKLIFDLLVQQHPAYGDYSVVNEQWAWARKTGGLHKTVQIIEKIGIREKRLRSARKSLKRGT